MRKNVASQVVAGQVNSRVDGSPLTSAAVIFVTGDGGAQGAGGGTLVHEGNGCWSYVPTQAETNFNHVAFTFGHATGVYNTVNVYPVAFDPYDVVDLGLTNLDAAITTRLAPTVAGRTLDVSVGGEAGLAWANIGSPTTAQNLSATNIDVDQVVASVTAAVTVGTINANVITAASIAADAGVEIASAVWNEDATGHQTGGTFGQAIGDPGADTNTIFKAVVTDATGATVGVDVVAIKAETASIQADTDNIQSTIGTPAGASVSADILAIDNFVDDLETRLGVPSNLGSGATIAANLVDIESQTDDIGVAGAGLTAIDLPDQTMNITGNLSGSVGSVTAPVTVGTINANVITAAAIATDAIDADALAADAVAEIAAASSSSVWSTVLVGTLTAQNVMKVILASVRRLIRKVMSL